MGGWPPFDGEKPGHIGVDGGIYLPGPPGTVSGGDFLTVFLMVISFYFGTQNQRRSGEKP